LGSRLAHDPREVAEELLGQLARGAVNEPRADLGQLAADLGLDLVGQARAGAVLDELDLGPALGEAGGAALALARDGVAVRRIQIAQLDRAVEGGVDRTDLGPNPGRELRVGDLLDRLAAGYRLLQDLGIVQGGPDLRPGRRNQVFAGHLHGDTPVRALRRRLDYRRGPGAASCAAGTRAAARSPGLRMWDTGASFQGSSIA